MKNYKTILSAIVITAGLFVVFQKEVKALAQPSGAIFGFSVTCAATPTKISNGTAYNTLRCSNPSTTLPTFIGNSSVNPANGYPILNSAGYDFALSMDVASPAYCITPGPNVVITCIGGQ